MCSENLNEFYFLILGIGMHIKYPLLLKNYAFLENKSTKTW